MRSSHSARRLQALAKLRQRITEERERRRLLRENSDELQGNLRAFVRAAWPIVDGARAFLPNWHIDAICDHLQAVSEGRIQNLVINVGPGFAKSLLVCVFWPAWMWLRNPAWQAIFTSYAMDLSVRDALRTRTLIESPWYRETFAPGWRLNPDQHAKDYYRNTSGGFRLSASVSSKGTGFRGDAIICDDPLNAREQHSEAARKEVLFWWDQVMSSRLNDQRSGAKVIIMQRLHEEDLVGHVLRRGGYEHLRLPTEFEPEQVSRTSIGFADPRTEAGELLFPALFPREVIEQAKRDLGSVGFAAQHQQRPSPAQGHIWQPQWFRRWRRVDRPGQFEEIITSWDMAFKDTQNSSYVVGQAWGKRGADKYLLDQVRARMDFVETERAFITFVRRWPEASTHLVEDKANGPAIISRLRGQIAGIVPFPAKDSKVARASAVAPQIEAGNVFVPDSSECTWVDEFLHEAQGFPNGPASDQVDTASQALLRLSRVFEREVLR